MNKIARLIITSPEPAIRSVVMTSGLAGTVWQRLASDGLWHSPVCSVGMPWEDLMEQSRDVYLVIDAATVSARGRRMAQIHERMIVDKHVRDT